MTLEHLEQMSISMTSDTILNHPVKRMIYLYAKNAYCISTRYCNDYVLFYMMQSQLCPPCCSSGFPQKTHIIVCRVFLEHCHLLSKVSNCSCKKSHDWI